MMSGNNAVMPDKVLVPVVDRLELAAVNRDGGLRAGPSRGTK
jgi:hypothetical protein